MRQSYERFTSLYFQACEYKYFSQSLVVTRVLKFNPLMFVFAV